MKKKLSIISQTSFYVDIKPQERENMDIKVTNIKARKLINDLRKNIYVAKNIKCLSNINVL